MKNLKYIITLIILNTPLINLFSSSIVYCPDFDMKKASKQAYYWVFCISNNTLSDLTYTVRWGCGTTRTTKLRSGYSQRHWYTVSSNYEYSPNVEIWFDYILSDGRISNKRYDLKVNGSISTDCSSGSQYSFDYPIQYGYYEYSCVDLFSNNNF